MEHFNSAAKVDNSKVKYPSQEHALRGIAAIPSQQTIQHRAAARYYRRKQFEKYVTLNHSKSHVFLGAKFGKKKVMVC